jgi:hypothetical protein
MGDNEKVQQQSNRKISYKSYDLENNKNSDKIQLNLL